VKDAAALQTALSCDLPTWTDQLDTQENVPINCITWFEAMAFCIWDGGFLATEAEWNYAAAGGEQQRAYPWSSPPGALVLDPSHASYFDGTDCVGDGQPDCTLSDIYHVGARPNGDGRWGQSDLAGNIAEWTLDWAGTYPASCVDCANLGPAAKRIARGGGFATDEDDLRTGSRLSFSPSTRSSFVGARCARAAR
jgi:formylglycine-generating enzyme required for sulfatase activity